MLNNLLRIPGKPSGSAQQITLVREEVDKEHQESHWGTLRDGSGEEWECPQSGYLEMDVTMEERRPMLSQVNRLYCG